MKFTKFGKALLLSALSAGVILSVTSCIQSYTIGYLYVTGTVTATPSGNGIITGFKIDHNTGKLKPINGLPVSSGGANPVRAVLLQNGQRFVYVLNKGANKEGTADCTSADPCLNSNITEFAVGANGILTPQETFYTQGVNPFRLVADTSGAHLYVLDHDSPAPGSTASNPIASSTSHPNTNCSAALGDTSTGRLTLIENAVATTNLGTTLTYFPVPSNPIDFVLANSTILTLSGTAGVEATVFPYTYASSTGQLTINSNSAQPVSALNATAIVNDGGFIWVLDNTPYYSGGSEVSASQIWAFTAGASGSLTSETNSPIADDASQSNPIFLVVEASKSKWFYVANAGNEASSIAETGIAGYLINSPFAPTEITGKPIGFGAGAGPQCLVEDPSKQFFYTANSTDSTVTAQSFDENAGTLTPLSQSGHAASSYSLTGPATWCFIDSRTN
jgi:6-phosphogluconolactonase (cycloisomerase 2 family)